MGTKDTKASKAADASESKSTEKSSKEEAKAQLDEAVARTKQLETANPSAEKDTRAENDPDRLADEARAEIIKTDAGRKGTVPDDARTPQNIAEMVEAGDFPLVQRDEDSPEQVGVVEDQSDLVESGEIDLTPGKARVDGEEVSKDPFLVKAAKEDAKLTDKERAQQDELRSVHTPKDNSKSEDLIAAASRPEGKV